jgi:thiamine pyrophosphate-dependent acetolactate synthase large subunit-like protein
LPAAAGPARWWWTFRKDVSFNKTPYAGYPDTVEMRSYNPVRKGHGGQIRKALQLLLTAKRPTSTPAAACC